MEQIDRSGSRCHRSTGTRNNRRNAKDNERKKTKKSTIRAEIQTKQMTISAPLTADINILRGAEVGFERSPMPKMRFARAAPANQSRSAPTGSRASAIDNRRNFFFSFLDFLLQSSAASSQHTPGLFNASWSQDEAVESV